MQFTKHVGLQEVYQYAVCLGAMCYFEDKDSAVLRVCEALWFHSCFVINSKATKQNPPN